MWLSTLQTLGGLAGSHFPKVAKGAADALERLVLEVSQRCIVSSSFGLYVWLSVSSGLVLTLRLWCTIKRWLVDRC